MTIDDSTMAERTFTETHDRILHALVEQVHDMGRRLAALESELRSSGSPAAEPRLAPPAIPTTPAVTPTPPSQDARSRHADRQTPSARARRPTGWQPARR